MSHWIRILVPALLVVSALSGCFDGGDDGNGGDNGNGDEPPVNGNQTNGNNTDDPPVVPTQPVPRWTVAVADDDTGEAYPAPFYIPRGANITITLDGSGSTVANGTVDVYAWTVVSPVTQRQHQQSGPNPQFSISLNNTGPAEYGVYTLTLRTLAADTNQLNSTTGSFVLSMAHQYTWGNTILGPGLPDCGQPQGEAGPLNVGQTETGFYQGTYVEHQVGTAPNITSLDFTLTYNGSDETQMRLRIFEEKPDEGDCAAELASSEAGPSPLEFNVSDLPAAATGLSHYYVWVQLEGPYVDDYVLTVRGTYAAPSE